MIRVLLVDDHEIIRTGMKLLLRDEESIEVIGEATNGETAINLTRELSPDIVIMDINMPGIGGFEAILRISQNISSPKILVVSTHTNDIIPTRLVGLGVSGYLTKQANQKTLVDAVHTVYEGGRYIEPYLSDTTVIKDSIAELDTIKKQVLLEQLNEREFQILLMVAKGMDTSEISKKLFLTNKTINGYRNVVLKKLGVKTNVDATRIAITYGLVDVDTEWH